MKARFSCVALFAASTVDATILVIGEFPHPSCLQGALSFVSHLTWILILHSVGCSGKAGLCCLNCEVCLKLGAPCLPCCCCGPVRDRSSAVTVPNTSTNWPVKRLFFFLAILFTTAGRHVMGRGSVTSSYTGSVVSSVRPFPAQKKSLLPWIFWDAIFIPSVDAAWLWGKSWSVKNIGMKAVLYLIESTTVDHWHPRCILTALLKLYWRLVCIF
jgi:hypothetical protein